MSKTVFLAAIIGIVTGCVIITIIGFVLITISGGFYPTPTDLEELGVNLFVSAIIFGSLGVIIGLITGVGIAKMGIRPHSSLIWPLIIGTSILLGGSIVINADIIGGHWYIIILLAIISAIVNWVITRVIERILSKRLNRGGNTPRLIWGYIAAFVLMALITSGLLLITTNIFAF